MRKLIFIIPFFVFQIIVSQEIVDSTEIVSIRKAHFINLKTDQVSFPHEIVTEYKSGYIKTQIGELISFSKYYPEDPFNSYNREEYAPVIDKKNGLIKEAKSIRHTLKFRYNKEKRIVLREKSSNQERMDRCNILRDYYFYKNDKLIRVDQYGIRDSISTDSIHGRSIIYKYKNSL